MKPPGAISWKEKQSGVGEHLRQRYLIRHVVGDPHGGTVGRPHAPGGEHVADEQRLSTVERVDVLPRVGIPEVEALGHLLVRVVGVAVELHAVGEQVAEVAEQLQVVLYQRVAPDLRRVGHGRVARRDERRRVGPLHAPIGRIGVAVLEAEVGEARGAQRQPGVAGDGVGVPVARPVGAGVELEAAAGPVVLEQEVQHPGDGVRAVLRRRPVTQHLDLPQRNGRDGRNVRPLRAVGHAGEPREHRRPMPPLAVDQDERVIVGEVAQGGRPDERGRVADRMRGDVERRDQGAQLVVQRGGALADDVLERYGVDGNRRFGDRPGLGAAADDDHQLFELHRKLAVDGRCRPAGDGHAAPHHRSEAGQRERHIVGAGRQLRDRERTGAVGDRGAGPTLRRAARLHGDARQREAGRVGHRAGHDRILRGGNPRVE